MTMGLWAQASSIAEATPADRNRYVDFLRALSILFVISGHWLITTGYWDADAGSVRAVRVLDSLPWTQWLTWVFQVMPVFFIVGGYSNAISLESAQRRSMDYAGWLAGRLQRLLTPLLLLVVVWAAIAFVLGLLAIPPETVRFLTQAALVPTWFLAIYTMIVLLAPATYAVWRRWGVASLAAYVALAALVDWAFFDLGWKWPGWSNYFWVWLAMHHLGFAWRDGRLGGPPRLLALSAVSLLLLAALIYLGPYPVAMAGSPGEAVSNTLPPKVTLIALGMAQFGLLLALEKPMQGLLTGHRLWTCTVIINTMIMSIYLWHMTILLFALVCSHFFQGVGLTVLPGSAAWWWSRPLWLAILALLLVPVALLLSPLERLARPEGEPVPPALRLVGGAVMVGLGISLATLFGFDGSLLSPVSTGAIALVLVGAWVSGIRVRLPGR